MEVIALISENVYFLKNHGDLRQLGVDTDTLSKGLSLKNKADIRKRVKSDINYAQRLYQSSDLDPLEIDLMCSLVNGALAVYVTLQEISVSIKLDVDAQHWIRGFLSSNTDLSRSEERMSRNNPLYLKTSSLLDTIDEQEIWK